MQRNSQKGDCAQKSSLVGKPWERACCIMHPEAHGQCFSTVVEVRHSIIKTAPVVTFRFLRIHDVGTEMRVCLGNNARIHLVRRQRSVKLLIRKLLGLHVLVFILLSQRIIGFRLGAMECHLHSDCRMIWFFATTGLKRRNPTFTTKRRG